MQISSRLHANNNTDQQAMETLLSLAETYAGHGRDVSSQGTTATKGARDNTIMRKAETNLRVCRIHR